MSLKTVAREVVDLVNSPELKSNLIGEIHTLVYNGVDLTNFFSSTNRYNVSPWALITQTVPQLAELYLWAAMQQPQPLSEYERQLRSIIYKTRQSVTEAVVDDILRFTTSRDWERFRKLSKGTGNQILNGRHFPTIEWVLSNYPEYSVSFTLTVDGVCYEFSDIPEMNKTKQKLTSLLLRDKTRLGWLVTNYPNTTKYITRLSGTTGLDFGRILVLLSLPDITFDIVVTIPK